MNDWHPIFQYFFDFVFIIGILITVAIVLIPNSDGSPEIFQFFAVIMFLVSYIVGVRRGKNISKVETEG